MCGLAGMPTMSASASGPEEGKCKGSSGTFEIAEMALVRLYEANRPGEILTLIRFFLEPAGDLAELFSREEKRRLRKEADLLTEETTPHTMPITSP